MYRNVKVNCALHIEKKGTQKTAHEKECAKEPINVSDISTAQSNEHDNTQDGKNTFNLRNYGLSDLQAKFVNEYLIDLNRAAMYKRPGYKGEGNTAYINATRMLRNAKVLRTVNYLVVLQVLQNPILAVAIKTKRIFALPRKSMRYRTVSHQVNEFLSGWWF